VGCEGDDTGALVISSEDMRRGGKYIEGAGRPGGKSVFSTQYGGGAGCGRAEGRCGLIQ
jgi:hypothetical protein